MPDAMPCEDDRPEWRETDTWIVPPLAPDEPEPDHAPALTRDGFTEALRALGRDGGER